MQTLQKNNIMALQCGIVGLPNVGKSTLFNCLSNAKAQSANFPFCTIEPNLGVITVPDPRLNKLAELVQPQNVLPTTVEIVDIAGLVKGASKGEGLGNKFLGNIRTTDAIIHVLRCFDDDNIIHVDASVDPIRDKEVIDMELQLRDLESLEAKKEKVGKAARTGDKIAIKELAFYDALEDNEAAVRQMGEDKLCQIAKAMAEEVKNMWTIDWAYSKKKQAQFRIILRDLLADFGYPPEESEKAIETVLEQARINANQYDVHSLNYEEE